RRGSTRCCTAPRSSVTSRQSRKMRSQRSEMRLDGWLIIDKPEGITSARVVAAVKRASGAAKIGHAGTLDPLASGVLPLALGEATKTVSYMMDERKSYSFTVTWGEERSTDDVEGKVTQTSAKRPSKSNIETILPQFIGRIQQTP